MRLRIRIKILRAYKEKGGERGFITRKEWEVIVVQLVFDCILDNVFQLEKKNILEVDFSSSCPSVGLPFSLFQMFNRLQSSLCCYLVPEGQIFKVTCA